MKKSWRKCLGNRGAKGRTAYTTLSNKDSCGERIIRMSLYPMDSMPPIYGSSFPFPKKKNWKFPVAWRADENASSDEDTTYIFGYKWRISCRGYMTRELNDFESGGNQIKDGSDEAAIKWLLSKEEK